jgi:hypothetical protein
MMTSPSRELTHRANRYPSLVSFYRADRRRRSSPEQDLGLWWRVGVRGPLYRAAWVRATGELYVTRLGRLQDPGGEVLVLGQARDRGHLETVLKGWRDVCPQPDSMSWLRHRAARLAPAGTPASAIRRGTRPAAGHGVLALVLEM